MTRLTTLLCSALLALATLFAQAADKPASIRIGSPDQGAGDKPFASGVLGLAHIRQQLEEAFAADGITVEWHFFKGAGPAVNEAFANRQLDFAGLGDLAAIIGRASGLDTRLILGGRGANMYLAATPESGIETLEDLEGKRVSVYRGTADQLSFARVLDAAGLKERDLRIVSLDWSAARAALAGRQIDAAWSGMGILALGRQGIEFPVDTRQLPVTATTQTGVVASAAFIERYPEATQKLVDVLVANADWISTADNLDAYIDLLAQQSAIPAELFVHEYQDDDLAFRASPRLDAFLRHSYQDSIDKAKALGLIRRAFQVDDWFDERFVERAIEHQNLQARWQRYDPSGMAE
ncbi:ABC transporter substrate-binding protein [Phytopseudomonas dryadis]|uniref:Alkanesulfonate-binding protein n=1 Tax=Phytopseudomonas dryadis TaxID=2487520 RepID=A0ABY1Z961_9GAMM|nr:MULTISPECIES: ABC transporter substrate-binding protein [Pseudomonas]TBV07985.1 alkanesulfonate-binding protein [Pseudomonas dryadis]TBV19380.1 alkanesulfonate-binding protein [Pseudomonas sp. FRB 230]